MKPLLESQGYRLAALLFIISLSVAWIAYAPGLGGSLHFDDFWNLEGLAEISDSTSFRSFVLSGSAGPLGRPIALWSFALQADAWPESPQAFLRVNVILHLLNGCLVAWFIYLVGLARTQTAQKAALLAAGTATLWMLLPILASSSLLIVQRMTTLSALFVLLGLIGYLYGRRLLDRSRWLGLCMMSAALVIGGSLASLSKENGALIFLFAAAIELSLLSAPRALPQRAWRAWAFFFLALPTIALFVYLANRLPYSDSTVLIRGFDGMDRLITQSAILWDYLLTTLLPNPAHIGPFHDDRTVANDAAYLANLLPALAWVVVIFIVTAFRKRIPLIAFAVYWYLFGHSLESTTVPLELYFEHRNYLPLLGPMYALVAGSAEVTAKWTKLYAASLVMYGLVLAIVLYSVTSLWGTPRLAAEVWQIHKPDSYRANHYLANVYLEEHDLRTADKVLRQFYERNPDAIQAQVQRLYISCAGQAIPIAIEDLAQLKRDLRTAPYSHDMYGTVSAIFDSVQDGRCTDVGLDDLYEMAEALLANPAFNSSVVRHNLNFLSSQIATAHGDLSLTMHHLETALRIRPNSETLGYAIGILFNAGLHSEVPGLIEFARSLEPGQRIRAMRYREGLKQVEVEAMDKISAEGL